MLSRPVQTEQRGQLAHTRSHTNIFNKHSGTKAVEKTEAMLSKCLGPSLYLCLVRGRDLLSCWAYFNMLPLLQTDCWLITFQAFKVSILL